MVQLSTMVPYPRQQLVILTQWHALKGAPIVIAKNAREAEAIPILHQTLFYLIP